mgnify:CR=1 FL=1
MVERIKIQPSAIEVFDSSGNKTFTTAQRYVKVSSAGAFKLGGYEAAPVRVGSIDPDYTDIVDYSEEGHLYYKNLAGNTAKFNITSNLGYLPAFSFLCLQPQVHNLYRSFKDSYNAWPSKSNSVYIKVNDVIVGTGYWDFYLVAYNWWSYQSGGGYACTFTSTGISTPTAGTVTITPATSIYSPISGVNYYFEQADFNSMISDTVIATELWYHRVLIDLPPTNLNLKVTE